MVQASVSPGILIWILYFIFIDCMLKILNFTLNKKNIYNVTIFYWSTEIFKSENLINQLFINNFQEKYHIILESYLNIDKIDNAYILYTFIMDSHFFYDLLLLVSDFYLIWDYSLISTFALFFYLLSTLYSVYSILSFYFNFSILEMTVSGYLYF